MGAFLFVGLDTGGTWKPMLGLASQLAARGHTVTILGSPSMESSSLAAGCGFIALPASLDERPRTSIEDDDWRSWDEKVTGLVVAQAMAPAASKTKADVLVIDFLQFNALSAAETIDRPVASVVHYAPMGWAGQDWNQEVALVNKTRATLGLDLLPEPGGIGELWSRVKVALSLVPAEWAEQPIPGYVLTVGPIAASARGEVASRLPWAEDDPKPLVVISMSSTYMHQEALLNRTARAAARVDAHVVLSLAGVLTSGDVDVPDSVAVRSWLDFADVLPSTRVLVTHGGMATTCAALAAGVPMLMIPQGRDQDQNARLAAEAGAAIVLAPESSETDMAAAINALLTEEHYRQAADSFGTSLRALGGGRLAVACLEELLPAATV